MQSESSLPYSQEPPLVPILSQVNPVHITALYFSKIHPNNILSPMLGFVSGIFPSGFRTKTLYWVLYCPMCATCTENLILLDMIILIVKLQFDII
jgi:hypothetical protein